MGKIIAVSNQKGGVGKTSTAINLSYALSAKGKKVLLCDVDPQGNATTGLGIDKGELEKSVYDVIIDQTPAREAIIKTKYKNLDVLPSNLDLAGAEVELVSMSKRERRMKAALESVRKDYDYIILDCPPAIGLLTINGLFAADSVLVPIQSEFYAMEGLAQLMNTVKMVKSFNHDFDIEGVLITMYDGRALISRQIREEITRFFGDKVYKTVIPRNVRVSEAPSHGEPVMVYDRKCRGALAYFEFSEEFIGRCK